MQTKKTENKKSENFKEPQKKKSKNKIILIILLVLIFCLLAGLLLWIFLWKQPSFTGENIYFNISGRSELAAGETVSWEIEYANNENVELENVEISIIYPDGFIFKSADPKSKSFNDNKWVFSSLKPGEAGSILIKGDLYGEAGASLVGVANMVYKPRNVSSKFNQIAELSTKISSANIDLEVDVADTAQKDQELELIVRAKNNTDFDINNVRIEGIWPDNFELISAEPNYKSSYYWSLPNIAGGKEEEIKLKGKISGEIGEQREFKFRFGLFDARENFYLQKEELVKIKIVDISGDLKLLVNGVEEAAKNPGDLLEYTLFYKNTGSEALQNNVLSLDIDNPDLLDQSSIVTDEGELTDGKVAWSYEKIERLKTIEPGQEGAFVFKIKIASPVAVKSIDDINFVLKAKPKHIAQRGSGTEEVVIEGQETLTKINTEVSLAAEARYYDFEGKQAGSGPLPPKVGEKTIYRVYLSLNNRTNDVENSRVQMLLGERANWEKKVDVSVGDLKFEGGKIIWEIGKIPANTGQFANQMQAEFDIAITPQAEDAGKMPDLLTELQFTGMDSFTNNNIEFTEDGLNTALSKDFLAEGKAEVSN